MPDTFAYDHSSGTYRVPVSPFDDAFLGGEPAATNLASVINNIAVRRLRANLGLSQHHIVVSPAYIWSEREPHIRVTAAAFPKDIQYDRLADALRRFQPRFQTIECFGFVIYADADARPEGDDWAAINLGTHAAGLRQVVGVATWINFGPDPANPRPAGLHITSSARLTDADEHRVNHPADLAFCVEQTRALFWSGSMPPLPALFVGGERPAPAYALEAESAAP